MAVLWPGMLRCLLCWWSQSRRCFYLCPDNHKQDQSGSRCDIARDRGRGSVLVCDVLTCSLLSICCFQLSAVHVVYYLLSANSAGKKTPLLSYVQSKAAASIFIWQNLENPLKIFKNQTLGIGKGQKMCKKEHLVAVMC